jgi:7,8-dihydro-6-hydroxymethylpterin-pyrophosphokinase
MSLPANFSQAPGEKPWRDFQNLCIQFRKQIKASEDSEELQKTMDQFINDSRELQWNHKTSGHYQKDAAEKMTTKVYTEFKRYIESMENPQDLLDALAEVESFIRSKRG